jgi:hypothetical protein
MSIQQSINQTLGSATIAAGLFAHSPAGQRYAATKQKQRDLEYLNKEYDRYEAVIAQKEAEARKKGLDPKKVALEDREAQDVIQDRIRQGRIDLGELNPTAKDPFGTGTALKGELEAKGEMKEEKAGEERDAKSAALKKSILEGTPSEHLLLPPQEQKKIQIATQAAEQADIQNVNRSIVASRIRERANGGLVLGPYESEGPGGERLQTRIFGAIPTNRANTTFDPKGGK